MALGWRRVGTIGSMSLELLFLGSGTSAGVPLIGCECEVCRSSDPRDQRTRASVVVRYPDAGDVGRDEHMIRQFMIDTTPEMRMQVLRHRIMRIDGVLFTHAHADHIFGLDDLRRFNAAMDRAIDIYAEAPVMERFFEIFSYVFEPHKNVNDSFIPQLIANRLEPEGVLDLHGARWTPLRLLHGRLPILGFRVDWEGQSLAYCTDVSRIVPETYPLLEGLDVLVLDALRYRHHPTHMTVDQALEQIDRIRPGRAYLTHIAHDISHADLEPRLPEHVFLAFDGLSVRCRGESGSE